eukprot:4605580-Amphidinium_carterae.3
MVPFHSEVHGLSSTFYALSDLDQCSFMSVDIALGVIDTGAVNAVMGLETLLRMDERLRVCGVGTIRTKTPPNIGGIGGGVVPLMGVMIPAVLESVPGILNASVIPGGVPIAESSF